MDYQFPKILSQYLSNYDPPLSDERLLELGVGSGILGPLLKPYAHTLIGLDLSEQMLSEAKLRGLRTKSAIANSLSEKEGDPDDAADATSTVQMVSKVCY